MPVRLSCPSCNSSFALAGLPPERRAACPRCGDVFPVRSWEEASPDEASSSAPPIRTSTHRDRARWSVQRAVLVAILMGLVGLVAGLGVYLTRKTNHSPNTPSDRRPESAVTAPSDLIGLGYLPSDAGLVFVLQPGPALAFAVRTKQEPRDVLTRAGIPPQFFDVLARLGISLEQVDHVAGAANVDALRLALVIVLRQSLDEEQFLRQLRASRTNGVRERYSTDVGGLPLTLARVSATVWVFGFDAKKDLEGVERGGHGAGGKQFASGLAEMISRVPPDAAAWIATDEDRWSEKPLVRMVIGEVLRKPEWLPVLGRGRSLAAALSLNDPPRLRLFIRAADASTGGRLRAYFQTRSLSTDGATAGGAGELAFFETPIDPATTFATLRDMLSEAVKP
jgi:hypothetical protein